MHNDKSSSHLSIVEGGGRKRKSWHDTAQRDYGGNVMSNLENALQALRHEFDGGVAFDMLTQSPILCRPVPQVPHIGDPTPRPLTDTDVTGIQEFLQRRGLKRLGKDATHQAVDYIAHESEFHPVRDYLTGLKWDGIERVQSWLTDYMGAEPTPYTQAIGRMFLVSTVARIMQPGCKCDYMLILEGKQGSLKSSAVAILAGEWFSDSLPDIRTKDAQDHVRGKWIIEVGELSALSRADCDHLKDFITRQDENFRPAYGRQQITAKRQCVFIGTTNKKAYLHDETGGRRFWPVKVGRIGRLDIEALSRDRDQLFAEAVASYNSGEQWWPDQDFEREYIKPEQDDRYEADAWEELILEYINRNSTERVKVTEIGAALGIQPADLGTAQQNRIRKVLDRHGWTANRNKHERWYEPPKG